MPRYEIAYEFTPALGPTALKCLLWKRGSIVGPIALVLLPITLLFLAANPETRGIAILLGGGMLMLLGLFLAAVWQRRAAFNRFLKTTPDLRVQILFTEDGVSIHAATGQSELRWAVFERVWRCKTVALLFYHGWQYIALPVAAVPPGALEYAEERLRDNRRSH